MNSSVARLLSSALALLFSSVIVSGCVYAKQVTISSDPAGATVFIDGVQRGTTPYTTNLTWEGPWETANVSIKMDGYDDARVPIKFQPDYERKYFVALTRSGPPPSLNLGGESDPFCPQCGHKFAPDSRYCAGCGRPR
ncbi:PEGA domain-containing protein [bacterium]|nr:PEGA domain-containing protein [bacterium]